MSDFYTKPTAEYKEDKDSKNRIAHSIFAAAATFIVVPTIAISIFVMAYGQIAPINILSIFLVSLIFSIAAGFVVLPFRTLRWYWAILAGTLFGPCFLIILGIILDVLARLT